MVFTDKNVFNPWTLNLHYFFTHLLCHPYPNAGKAWPSSYYFHPQPQFYGFIFDFCYKISVRFWIYPILTCISSCFNTLHSHLFVLPKLEYNAQEISVFYRHCIENESVKHCICVFEQVADILFKFASLWLACSARNK